MAGGTSITKNLLTSYGDILMNHRQKLDRFKARLQSIKESVKRDRVAWIKAEDHVVAADEAKLIIQQVGQALQEEAHDRIAGVVSRCLEAVFDEPYEFKIVFERKRGQTEARLVFIREGLEINPLDAAGGGAVDVAAFALRLSCIMLKRPAVRRVLVMDEAFRFLSQGYRPRVRQLLESLSKKMGVQFIQITHIPELVTGKVIELG